MEEMLALQMVRVTEAAALASRLMGRGDNHEADRYAVESMRRTLDEMAIDATIVIGEGERDEAPMLYIGERVGTPSRPGRGTARIDIAVDPLEGTNLCARGQNGDHRHRRLGGGRPSPRPRLLHGKAVRGTHRGGQSGHHAAAR